MMSASTTAAPAAASAADTTNSPNSSGEGNADGEKPPPTASTPAESPRQREPLEDPMGTAVGGHGEDTSAVGSSKRAEGGGDPGKERRRGPLQKKAEDRMEVSSVDKTAAAEIEPKPAATQTGADASPAAGEAQASKKRPREGESKDGTSGAAAAAAPGAATAAAASGAAAAAAAAAAERSEKEAGDRSPPSGGDGKAPAGLGRERGASAAAGPEVPKPLEDPGVDEVVSQDLATQEVKRVRRKGNDPTASPVRQVAAAAVAAAGKGGVEVAATGGNGRVAGDAEVEQANGTAQREQRAQVDGPRPADGERKKQLAEGGGGTEVGGEGAAACSGGGGASTLEEGKKALASAAAAAGESPGVAEEADTGLGIKQANGMVAVLPSTTSTTKSDAMPPPPSSAAAKSAPASSAPATAAAAAAATTNTTAASAESTSPSSSPSSAAGEGVAPPSESGKKGVPAAAGSEIEKPGPAEGAGAAGPQPMEEEEETEADGKGKGKEGAEAVAAAAAAGAGAGAAAAAKRPDSCPGHASPSARTFFDYETASALEIRMLPEFFTGRSASKTPEVYIQSRNYMVRSYQRMLEADPGGQAFLSGTECRRKLAGDACSILRIHDFLDRFGLINTRAAGKRPVSLPVVPPSTHLWNPTPPAAPPSLREGGGGGASAAAERGLVQGGARAAAAGARAAGRGGGGGGGRPEPGGPNGGDGDREWHREELVLLMEAAVANPHQWDAVAHRVAGGRTPAACMKRFLTLAVEEVVGEDEKLSASASAPALAPSEKAASAAGTTPPDAGGTAGARSGAGVGAGGGGKSAGADADEGSSARGPEGQRQSQQQQQQRPVHLGQAVPALVLASALVSTVHPEVLTAAMAAAAEAVDGVVRRFAADADKGGGDRGARPGSSSGGDSGGGGGDKGGVSAAAEMTADRRGDGEEPDVEMRDVERGGGTAAGSSEGEEPSGANGRGGISAAAAATATATAVPNGGQRESQDSGSSGGGLASVAGLELAGAARAAVLSVASLQARALAEQEERRTEALLSDLLEARVQRLEAKLHCFDELDQVLETERQSLEHDRAELLLQQARSML